MIGKLQERNQRELFRPMLEDFIDMNHELVLLSKSIDWSYFDREFEPYYCFLCPSCPHEGLIGKAFIT